MIPQPLIVVPTLHPAFLLRENESWTPAVVDDFKRAWACRKAVPRWDEGNSYCFPTVAEIEEVANECHKRREVALDIENIGEHPLEAEIRIFGFGHEGRACVVHLLDEDGAPYWRPVAERKVRDILRQLMQDERVAKIGHNIVQHDFLVIEKNGLGPVRGRISDSLISHHVADGEMPHSLAYVTSRYTFCPYYKSMIADPDQKGGLDWGKIPSSTLALYNRRDVITAARVRKPIEDLFTWPGARPLYKLELEINQILRKFCERGINVDWPQMDPDRPGSLAYKLRSTAASKLVEMQDILKDRNFRPGSVPQLRTALYDRLGFPMLNGKVYWTKGGLPSTGKQVLFELQLRADERQGAFLRAVSAWRKAKKLDGTYVSGLELLGDGKAHPQWRLLTKTGRYACTPAVNTLPKKIKMLYVAAKGNVFFGSDLNQAELRSISEVMGVPRLQKVYELGLDAHTVNAVGTFKLRPPRDYKPKVQAALRDPKSPVYVEGYDQLPVDKDFDSGARWLMKRGIYSCIFSGTKVALLNGAKPICQVQPGDWTWVCDGEKYAHAKIKTVVCHGRAPCVRVLMDAGGGVARRRAVIITPDHKMLLRDGSYKRADQLKAGDRLMPFSRHNTSTGYKTVLAVTPCGNHEVWDLEVDHPAHNFALEKAVFVANCSYQSTADTIWRALRAETDSETGALLFPDLPVSQVIDFRESWRRQQPEIPAYAMRLQRGIGDLGYYESPFSGRRVYYRGGVTLQEAANVSIQESIAAKMNKAIVKVEREFQKHGILPGLFIQTHDFLGGECTTSKVDEAVKILVDILSEPLPYKRGGVTRYLVIPPDEPKIGSRLSEI